MKHRTEADKLQMLAGNRFGIADPTKLHPLTDDCTKTADDIMDQPFIVLQIGNRGGRIPMRHESGNLKGKPVYHEGDIVYREISSVRAAIRVSVFCIFDLLSII